MKNTEIPKLVAITGASGFIGGALYKSLKSNGKQVRALVRKHSSNIRDGVAIGDIGPKTEWENALRGTSCVVHCAGRAHILNEKLSDPLSEYRRVNREGSIRLAEQAANSGVKRLIFLSSVGVMGTKSDGQKPFTAFDRPEPTWDYAISKWEAEQELAERCDKNNIELVVVRPPITYGPNVPANFLRLLKIVKMGFPLPFSSIKNKRSMVGIENLVDLLNNCIVHPKAAGQTFMVSDGHDLSTPELIRSIAAAMNRPANLLPIPTNLLRLIANILGRQHDADRLISSLQVDIQHTCKTLNWTPPVTVEAGLRHTIEWCLENDAI